jgi:hypothetical protein
LSEGVGAKVRCHRQKYVQQLRGTRKVGGVFAVLFHIQIYEAGKASARYEVVFIYTMFILP